MKSFQQIRTLLHNSTTFYLISVNMDSTYGYVNNHYKNLFEKEHGNLVGQHYSITIHHDDQEVCAAVAAQCFAEPENIFPATIRKHDGQGGYIATQWDYKAMFNENNQPAGIFCIGYDITEFMKTTVALSQMEFIQSHVIRKPIANLLGLIGLLKTVRLSPESEQIMDLIDEASKELDNFIKESSN